MQWNNNANGENIRAVDIFFKFFSAFDDLSPSPGASAFHLQ